MNNNENIAYTCISSRTETVDYHFHMHHEIFYVEKGSLTVFLPQREYIIYSGELCIISPLTPHKTFYKDACIKKLAFNSDYLLLYISKNALDFIYNPGKDILFIPACDGFEKAKQIMDKIVASGTKGSYIYIFMMLKEAYSGEKSFIPCKKTLSKAIDCIDAHIMSKITPEKISENCNITRFHLCRLVKSAMGITPVEYINFLKIKQAVIWLNSTSYTVKEISEKLSFSSPKYFTKVFKHYFSVAPSDFRKLNEPSLNKKIFLGKQKQ